ncbi:MAG: hypothetical protein R3Y15_03025 [Rikenellaceae bacterium]
MKKIITSLVLSMFIAMAVMSQTRRPGYETPDERCIYVVGSNRSLSTEGADILIKCDTMEIKAKSVAIEENSPISFFMLGDIVFTDSVYIKVSMEGYRTHEKTEAPEEFDQRYMGILNYIF